MKSIPVELLAHKAQPVTTLTELLLVGPLPDDSYRGFTALDIDVDYDNGAGLVTYKARTGFHMSELLSTSDVGVDNAEAVTLHPVASYDIEGFTQAQIDAGDLDKCRYVVYSVNYNDLTSGRHEIVAGGTIGEQRTKHGQMTILELRSLSQQLKQTVGELDSLSCRAKFGSLTGRGPCGYDLALEWVAGTVGSVGADADLQFTDASLTQAADYFAPGFVEWLSGPNLGQENEVEAFALGGVVTLQFPVPVNMTAGDTYRIRRECRKQWSGHNSCETFHGVNRALNYRGEPHIPVGDRANLSVPGAAISSASLGTGEGG